MSDDYTISNKSGKIEWGVHFTHGFLYENINIWVADSFESFFF